MPSLAHLGLAVGSIDAALAFLTGFLDFRLVSRFEPLDPEAVAGIVALPGARVREIAFVERDGLRLELLEYAAPAPPAAGPRASDPGFFHFAADVDDFPAAFAAAAALGFSRSAPPYAIRRGSNAGKLGGYLSHPDGLTLELIGPE